MARDIGLRAFAAAHALVLRIDIGHGQLHHLEQLGRGRIFLRPGLVGHDARRVDGKAVIAALVEAGIHLVRIGREWHFQPDHVLARHQHATDPVRCPRVVQNRFATLVAAQGIGDQGRIAALHVRHRLAQFVRIHVLLDQRFAAPAGIATRQVGLAIAIMVEQLGQGGIAQLVDIRDVVLFRSRLIDQITLRGRPRILAGAQQLGVAARIVIEILVHRVPVHGHEGGVAVGDGDMRGRVFHFLDRLHVIAQLFQGLVDQHGLEGFFRDRALQRLHLDALAG